LKDNTHSYFFCSFHNIDIFKQEIQKHFEIKNILIWCKNNTGMGDLFGDYAPQYEMIIYAQKGSRKLNEGRDSNLLYFNRTGNNFHPTEKPVNLMEYLITKSSNNGDLILDCFAGSGSTLVACKNLKRNFIGIELDKDYCDISQKRLDLMTNSLF
jgi:site-specific DNA-methyltransferase (adenine-specific)